MKHATPSILSRFLSITILAIGSIALMGRISSQVTDPVEIDRQVAFAESDMEITTGLATRRVIASLEPDEHGNVAGTLPDVSSNVLDTLTSDTDSDAPLLVADLTNVLAGGRFGVSATIVHDRCTLIPSRMSEVINRQFGNVDAKSRAAAMRALIYGTSRDVRGASEPYLAHVDPPSTTV